MALNKDEQYLLKNVFPKVKYDELLEKYVIRLSDYLPLKLTKEQRTLLEKICEKNNIELEKLPNKLTLNEETNELFREYDRLRKEITLEQNPQNKDKLKQKAIEVRNKIAEGYLEIMYNFITSSVEDIEKLPQKEDIYQDGYERLINLIESFEVDKGIRFIEYLYYYGYDKIMNSIRYIGQKKVSHPKLLLLISKREQYIKENGKEPTKEQLSYLTGLTISKIEDMLKLEQFLSSISLSSSLEALEENRKEEPQNETSEEDDSLKEYQQYESYLIDSSYENHIYSITFKELISKIVDTLPSNQKEVITLYYGLNNERQLTLEEIAKKLKLITQSVSKIKIDAIKNLRLPMRAKYLQEIIENYTDSIYPDMEDNIIGADTKKETKRRLRELEVFLIPYLPKEELMEVLNEIDPLSRDFLILLFGLANNKTYTNEEIRKELHLTKDSYSKIKERALTRLIFQLMTKYSSNKYFINEEELLDYLMTNYLNKGKRKH